MKQHIERLHNKIGEPTKEDIWHSTHGTRNFIRDVTSLQNNNNYYQNQRGHPNFFLDPYLNKEESTSKKRDALDEVIEFWGPQVRKMKEVREIIKSLQECLSPVQQQQQQRQQPYITTTPTNLVQTPIIIPIILPLIMTTIPTPLQPSPTSSWQQPVSVPKRQELVQEQEQKLKNEFISSEATFVKNLFNTTTLMGQDLQRRIREREDPFKAPLDVPLPPPIPTTNTDTSDYDNSNNNSKKTAGKANVTTIKRKEEEKGEEDKQMIEENEQYRKEHLPSSNANLPIDNDDNDNDGNGDVDGNRNSSNTDYDNRSDRCCLRKRDICDDDKIDRYKVIADESKEYYESS